MELIFNPCGEFRWSPEGPVSQIHSPHLHTGTPGIFSHLLRSVQMLKRVWIRKATRSNRTYLSLVKLQSWFLGLQWKTGLWTELRPGSCVSSERPALGQNTLMITALLYHENKDYAYFQFNWSSSFRDINLLLNFQNVPSALGFEVKIQKFSVDVSGAVQ